MPRARYQVGAALYRYDIQREYDRWFPAATLFVASDQDVRGIANLYPKVVAFAAGPSPAGSGAPGNGLA